MRGGAVAAEGLGVCGQRGAARAHPVLLTTRRRLTNVHDLRQTGEHLRVGLKAQLLLLVGRRAHEQHHWLARLQRRRHLHQAPHAEEGAQQLRLLGHAPVEPVVKTQLRHRLDVRAHQDEGLGRLHHRRKVEVLELLGRLLLRDAVLELPLQHGENVDPHVVLVVGDVREGGDQVAKGRSPRVAGKDLGRADRARRLLLRERDVATLAPPGRGLDDRHHHVGGAHAGRHLLDEPLEPAHLHGRVDAAPLEGLRLLGEGSHLADAALLEGRRLLGGGHGGCHGHLEAEAGHGVGDARGSRVRNRELLQVRALAPGCIRRMGYYDTP